MEQAVKHCIQIIGIWDWAEYGVDLPEIRDRKWNKSGRLRFDNGQSIEVKPAIKEQRMQ